MAGTTDVDRLLASLTPEQFRQWEAFDQLEPIGPDKLYVLLAHIGSAICSSNGMDIPPAAFLPELAQQQERQQSATEQQEAVRQYVERSNADFIDVVKLKD